MLARVFGLGPHGAAAALEGFVAVDLFEERLAAVADVLFDDPQRAALAHDGPGRPVGVLGLQADPPELRRRRLGRRFGERGEPRAAVGKDAHVMVIGRLLSGA